MKGKQAGGSAHVHQPYGFFDRLAAEGGTVMRRLAAGSSSPPGPEQSHPPLTELLTLACRAPSVHNTQPWQWRLHGDQLTLVADRSRQLKHADPDGRDLLLSCGAVLHHAQVVGAGLGWSARVRRMPDPADDDVLATLTFSRTITTPPAAAMLRTITVRQTDRRRFTAWPVSSERLHSLAATGSQWGAQVLPVAGSAIRSRLRQLTVQADEAQRRDPGYLSELDAWVRSAVDGLVPGVLPSRRAVAATREDLNRRFPFGTLSDPVSSSQAAADEMLLICTRADDTISRLRAGEAMSAVWLRATEEQLSVVPLSQALEVEDTRREIRQSILGDLACPQILLRVGWLPVGRADVPHTPRRPVSDVLVREPP